MKTMFVPHVLRLTYSYVCVCAKALTANSRGWIDLVFSLFFVEKKNILSILFPAFVSDSCLQCFVRVWLNSLFSCTVVMDRIFIYLFECLCQKFTKYFDGTLDGKHDWNLEIRSTMLPILFFMSFEWFVFAVFLLFAPKLLYEISGIILLNGWVFNQFVLMLKHSLWLL